MENTLYIVASHYENGPSLWVKSNKEEAIKKAKELLLVELNNIFDEDVVREMREALDQDNVEEANTIWYEYQAPLDTDYIEAIMVRPFEVDGDAIKF